MKTKYIIFTALLSVILPIQAHAAWYNPFTWFQDNLSTTTESVIAIEIDEPTFATTTDEVVEAEATSTVQTVTKTVVETKVVTKYVDNPALVAENTSLKARVAELTAKVNELRAERNLPPISEATVGASNEVPAEVVTPVASSITVSKPYCVERTYNEYEYPNGTDETSANFKRVLVTKSFEPKILIPQVDVVVTGSWVNGRAFTEAYPENNDKPQTDNPRKPAVSQITKEKSFVRLQNVVGNYPLKIEIYKNSASKEILSTYNGEVVIDKPCI